MKLVVYDSGVLIAADRNDRVTWTDHGTRVLSNVVHLVPAPVLAQVSRSSEQVQLRRFLRGCRIVPVGEADAHLAGRLLGAARMSDAVDALAVAVALRYGAAIFTSDKKDIERLVQASHLDIEVVAV